MWLKVKRECEHYNIRSLYFSSPQYHNAFQKWLRRLQLCVDSNGEYFENHWKCHCCKSFWFWVIASLAKLLMENKKKYIGRTGGGAMAKVEDGHLFRLMKMTDNNYSIQQLHSNLSCIKIYIPFQFLQLTVFTPRRPGNQKHRRFILCYDRQSAYFRNACLWQSNKRTKQTVILQENVENLLTSVSQHVALLSPWPSARACHTTFTDNCT